MTTLTVALEGMEMHCRRRGVGLPLLLLHGFTGSGADWELLFPDPPDGFEIIAPDLRGHGRSTNPGGEFSFRQSAADVLALVDALAIERFCAIGLSAGAKTLLHVATRRPERVIAQVLVSAAPYFSPQARSLMRQAGPESQGEEQWLEMRQRHHHGDEQIEALWRQGAGFAESFDDLCFAAADLATIEAPTLIVHGDRDPLHPLDLALELYTAMRRSQLWVVPGGGHGPIFGEQAAPFVATAVDFLRTQTTAKREAS